MIWDAIIASNLMLPIFWTSHAAYPFFYFKHVLYYKHEIFTKTAIFEGWDLKD